MEKDFTILIYEKDKILNSILIEQLSYFPKYKTCLIVDQINLFKIIHEKLFDACILNLDELEEEAINFIKIFQDINKHKNIILYHNNKLENSTALENNIILLKKPFKLKQLFNYIKNIGISRLYRIYDQTGIWLTIKHIITIKRVCRSIFH